MNVDFEADLNLKHLQIELARIDILIRREVRRWQIAGQDPADSFRGLYVSDVEVAALLNRPLGRNWGQQAALDPEEAETFALAEAKLTQAGRTIVETARRQGVPLRLRDLAEAFDLDRFALDALLICLAPTLDLRYERIYGYLQDDVTRKRPTVNLVLNLLSESTAERLLHQAYFARQASLFANHLLERTAEAGQPLLSHTLSIDESIVSWLLGRYQPYHELAPQAHLLQPRLTGVDRLLVSDIMETFDLSRAKAPLLVFWGPDQMAQDAAAHSLAARQDRHLLKVDISALIKDNLRPAKALKLTLRDARLTGAVPYFSGWDACLANDTTPPELLALLCAHPDLVVVAGQKQWQASRIDRRRNLFWLEFPLPPYSQRMTLWRHFLAQSEMTNGLETLDGLKLEDLAGQFRLTSGQIRDAIASARDIAAQAKRLLQNDDLFTAVRLHSNPRLATLARKIVPRYEWFDIILPADQRAILREIVNTVRERPLVLEEWGVGQKLASSKGVTVLFAGPPGTGKTMAAEIIAGELKLDLYKIDLSTIISKYIGETEKNLERIFNEASSSNAILFFDEADAIFGKRSEVKDAHDRYANIEVSYLLQRMEAYDGVTILATNLRANLDEAFTRRLQFAVDFPFPEEEDRLRIWETLFPPDVPRDEDLKLPLLARRFKLAGGNIRNIIVTAAYLAAADGKVMTLRHLLHGTRRELQKMGRLIGEEDLKI